MLCLFVFNLYANSNNKFNDNNNTISEIKLYKGWNLISMQENDFTKYNLPTKNNQIHKNLYS